MLLAVRVVDLLGQPHSTGRSVLSHCPVPALVKILEALKLLPGHATLFFKAILRTLLNLFTRVKSVSSCR